MAYNVQNFEQDVVERSKSKPVLVDFWAEWCGPCKVLGPVLEKLAAEHSDHWAFAKVNTEDLPDIAQQYGIRSIPNVKLFIDGEVRDEFTGALPESAILDWLKKALPNEADKQFSEARELLLNQQPEAAATILEDVLEQDPAHHHAALLLAQMHVYSEPDKALDLIFGIEADSPHYIQVEGVRTLAGLFQKISDPAQLPEADVKSIYIDAIERLHSGDAEGALENFISVIRTNRYYDDDGARRACIGIFKLLGEDHPITQEYRSSFSSSLYA
ncbi:MAG: thioredoxin [Calditrichia bacterium]